MKKGARVPVKTVKMPSKTYQGKVLRKLNKRIGVKTKRA